MRYSGPIIDVDVHHNWRSTNDLLEYLPQRWRDLVALPSGELLPTIPAGTNTLRHPGGSDKRMDTYPDTGSPGSDYEMMREQLLDAINIERAILCFDIGLEAAFPNPFLADALCRAANDWTIDNWLDGRDDRLYGAILVPMEWPEAAAAEIRRVAEHPGSDRVCEVLLVMNPLAKPFGHPVYDPIYEAAQEVGLPVAIHLAGEVCRKGGQAGGTPQSRLEQFVAFPQAGAHHAASLITHGLFGRYPDLKVAFTEHGFTWLPSLLWRLDSEYSLLKRESPWVNQLPSETFREHVIVATQPFDRTPEPRQIIELVESVDGIEDMVCFSTDYPHWDADDPAHLAARLPQAWHSKFFFENAARVFGWQPRERELAASAAVEA